MKSLLIIICICFSLPSIKAQSFNPKFFCFSDAFSRSEYASDPVAQAKLLKELGFDGIEISAGAPELNDKKLEAYHSQNLKVFMVWAKVDLEAKEAIDPRLYDLVPKLKDKGATVWVHIYSKSRAPSDPTGDSICISILQKLADYADDYGVRVALYPHQSDWLIKVGHAVELTQKVNRRNLGAVFNLCHYLKLEDRAQMETELTKAVPYLFSVSINGADDGDTNKMEWDRLIQPLGKGSFDVLKVLEILKKNEYEGPIGLQCYALKEKPKDHLTTSMASWKKYMKKLRGN
jgi:sugar phosphate isomerase/epimerase